MKNNNEIIDLLRKYNQEHLINLLNKIEGTKKEELLEQIRHIDFAKMMKLYEKTKNKFEKQESKIEYIDYLDKENLSNLEKERFDKLGEGVILNSEYAVVTMAGRTRNKIRPYWPQRYF